MPISLIITIFFILALFLKILKDNRGKKWVYQNLFTIEHHI